MKLVFTLDFDGKIGKLMESTKKISTSLYNRIMEDVKSIRERDPAARSNAEVLMLYPGFHALVFHRIANYFYKHKQYFLARTISQKNRMFTGIEIHPAAKIGKALFIDHGAGVVIGETVEIGDYCTIYQGVTLGGTGKNAGKRHPTIGNNVMIGAGAKVLGSITIGDNAKIAAGAVVLKDVPPNTTAVGIPARITTKSKDNNLDQVNISDPVAQELCLLNKRIKALEEKLNEK